MNGTYEGRLHTGYDFPGPHQGNFCSNGIVPATRHESPKLKEVKAVYQYVKFAMTEKNVKKNTASININNTYDFITLNGYELLWETVENGNIVGKDSMLLPAIAPDMSQDFTLKLQGTNLKNAEKNGSEVMLNLYVRNTKQTEWSAAGHTVAQKQFELLSRGTLPELKSKAKVAGLNVEKNEKEITVGNAFVFAAFDVQTGRI